MRNTIVGFSALLVLGGCASTQYQAVNEPLIPPSVPAVLATPVVTEVAPQAVAPQIEKPLVQEARQALDTIVQPPAQTGIKVVEADRKTDAQQSAQGIDTYQFMVAMAKNMQDALTLWTAPAKSCDVSTPTQR